MDNIINFNDNETKFLDDLEFIKFIVQKLNIKEESILNYILSLPTFNDDEEIYNIENVKIKIVKTNPNHFYISFNDYEIKLFIESNYISIKYNYSNNFNLVMNYFLNNSELIFDGFEGSLLFNYDIKLKKYDLMDFYFDKFIIKYKNTNPDKFDKFELINILKIFNLLNLENHQYIKLFKNIFN